MCLFFLFCFFLRKDLIILESLQVYIARISPCLFETWDGEARKQTGGSSPGLSDFTSVAGEDLEHEDLPPQHPCWHPLLHLLTNSSHHSAALRETACSGLPFPQCPPSLGLPHGYLWKQSFPFHFSFLHVICCSSPCRCLNPLQDPTVRAVTGASELWFAVHRGPAAVQHKTAVCLHTQSNDHLSGL